jgi:hypothetical protein
MCDSDDPVRRVTAADISNGTTSECDPANNALAYSTPKTTSP